MKMIAVIFALSILSVTLAVQCERQHTVVAGEYCYLIAQKYGLTLNQFLDLNPGINCDNLQIGLVVCVKGSSGGSDKIVSYDQFVRAVTGINGYRTPTQDQYNSFINNYATAGQISSLRELAMFLSEIMWESGGLVYKSEIRCRLDNCRNEYRSPGDDPNKFYYGRGYIQLTWSYNYRAASRDLFGDDRLVTDPDQVATNEQIAWQTAFWFWKVNVHPDPGVQRGQFGSATNRINGGLECSPCREACPRRNEIYAHVLPIFGVNEAPNFAGC